MSRAIRGRWRPPTSAARRSGFGWGGSADILALPPPSRRAPDADRQRLGRLKLQAALAVGKTAGLHADLAPLAAKLDAGEPLAVGDLRLLDDHAAALAADEPDRALALAEQHSRGARRQAPDADRRMVYRNAMTLARMHGRRGDARAPPRRA